MAHRTKSRKFSQNVWHDNFISILREPNGDLWFEINHTKEKIETFNFLEAVAILIQKKQYENSRLWNLNIENINPNCWSHANVLWWLSGGDKTWSYLKLDWLDYYQNLVDYFQHDLEYVINNSRTLEHCAALLKEKVNLALIYNQILKIKTLRSIQI